MASGGLVIPIYVLYSFIHIGIHIYSFNDIQVNRCDQVSCFRKDLER